MRRIELIINPQAGRGSAARLAPEVVAQLRAYGIQCATRYTRAPKEATTLVVEALRGGAECVAIAGGDGTLNEAVNGYLGNARDTQALACIPIGSGNDFAKMLGVGGDWRRACEAIAAGRYRRVDAGICNGHYFANGIGAGFDAQVALEAKSVRWLRGNAIYAAALARTLMLRHTTPPARLTHDGGVMEGRVTLVAAANGSCYGGAFRMAPEADIADGLLDLVVADALSRLGILALVPHVLRGTHVGRRGVTVLRTRRLMMQTETPLVVHADGEIIDGAATRLEIEVLPGALLVAA
ncbi:MAG: diacylglycerol kinase family lipid kinase [Betaproteobacteria bacterium]|nr:diacylglycerol kinase family lipid kinase [Betaproteobacteria bacterium]